MLGGVDVENVGDKPWSLTGRPRVRLFSNHGDPLPVHFLDMLGSVGASSRTRVILRSQVVRGAFVPLDWSNWCGGSGPVVVKLGLAESVVEVRPEDEGFSGRPRCDQPSAESTLSIGRFQMPS